ncbi:Glutathione S-transferase protein [Aphelenchoides besseyi]|nr:Glutathione S-transferase protein [Aphelenchoides besseyi]
MHFLPTVLIFSFLSISFVQLVETACTDLVPTCSRAISYCRIPSLTHTLQINCARTCRFCVGPSNGNGKRRPAKKKKRRRPPQKPPATKRDDAPIFKYPRYKLTYFGIRFRAEPIRLAFHYRNVPFEDVRLTAAQWAAQKSSYPDNQLPLLEVDGTKVSQSMTICRFVGRRLGLSGSNEMEITYLDYVAELWREFVDATMHYKRVANGDEPGDELAIHDAEFLPALKKYAPKMETLLRKQPSGFFGRTVSWVDFYVAGTVRTFDIIDATSLVAYPTLSAHYERVYALPQLQAYLKKDPPDSPI